MALIVHTAAFTSKVPHHLEVPPSKGADEAVASLEGSRVGSSALFEGSVSTAIALFSPASERENERPSCLLSVPYRALELVYA
jgi:hypothetical protein